MKQIANMIDRMEFIKECRCIHTAHVPVIKVIVDLKKVNADVEST
jgi:DNA polymerase sigma